MEHDQRDPFVCHRQAATDVDRVRYGGVLRVPRASEALCICEAPVEFSAKACMDEGQDGQYRIERCGWIEKDSGVECRRTIRVLRTLEWLVRRPDKGHAVAEARRCQRCVSDENYYERSPREWCGSLPCDRTGRLSAARSSTRRRTASTRNRDRAHAAICRSKSSSLAADTREVKHSFRPVRRATVF